MENTNPPYDDFECRHDNRTEIRGVLKCLDCSASYDENLMEWINND